MTEAKAIMAAFAQYAQDVLLPEAKSNQICLLNWTGTVDARICFELGTHLLLDKPIIVFTEKPAASVPVNLRRVATAVVSGDMADPETSQRLNAAIGDVIRNDRRVRV